MQFNNCMSSRLECFERLSKKTTAAEDCESPERFQRLVKAAVLQVKSQYTPKDEGQQVETNLSLLSFIIMFSTATEMKTFSI